MQKTDLINKIKSGRDVPVHVAIIMDGNRRWAKKNGFDVRSGHEFGAKKIEEIVDIAVEVGVKVLTLYAFSSENWNRSRVEVEYLTNILRQYISGDYVAKLAEKNIKFIAIGEIDKFDLDIAESIKALEKKTENNTKLTLCLTLSYGAKDEITRMTKMVAQKVINKELQIKDINQDVVLENMYLAGYPDPDLVIRAGGEKRISNFLLWYIAYSELYFSDKMWPEFTNVDFLLAIIDYQLRERRYGSV